MAHCYAVLHLTFRPDRSHRNSRLNIIPTPAPPFQNQTCQHCCTFYTHSRFPVEAAHTCDLTSAVCENILIHCSVLACLVPQFPTIASQGGAIYEVPDKQGNRVYNVYWPPHEEAGSPQQGSSREAPLGGVTAPQPSEPSVPVLLSITASRLASHTAFACVTMVACILLMRLHHQRRGVL